MNIFKMGDKRSENGAILRWEAESLSADLAAKMAVKLKDFQAFKILTSVLKKNKVNLYFEKYFKERIYPYIAQLLIVKLHHRQNLSFPVTSITIPDYPWLPLLMSVLPRDLSIPIYINRTKITSNILRNVKKYLRGLGELIFLFHQNIISHHLLMTLVQKTIDSPDNRTEKPVIAVRYVEGIDIERRSDIFWYPLSEIDPVRILIYFDGTLSKIIGDSVIKKIENMGIQWVSLRLRGMDQKRNKRWVFKRHQNSTISKDIKKLTELYCDNLVERWLIEAGINLLKMVDYWQAFFHEYNIKIHYDPEESGLNNITKNIALDLLGGFSIGKERSYLSYPQGVVLSFYPNHVFFVWNKKSSQYLTTNYNQNQNDYIIISGFTNDNSFERIKKKSIIIRQKLLESGAKFIVALFDNVHSMNDGLYQVIYTPHMLKFYKSFLEWVINDREVGIIIKSKKPIVLESIPQIHSLLEQAEDMGRCFRIPNEFGSLPCLAAFAADIAVTIGLSLPATLIESVLADCKGIHYDATNIKPFEKELYEWGYEKVIFDDIDRMIASCKRYKENPELEPGLGDFSEHVNELDPFRDGRAGQRVGTYIHWCLEGFDAGLDREAVLQQANTKYAEMWGADKVIDVRSLQQATQ